MSNLKWVYYVFVFFFSFGCSTDSSYLNTTLTAHKYKCSPQQSRALLLFKHSLFSITSYHYPCQDWLGAAGYYPIMMNWNTNTDCCDWDGVSCDNLSGDVIGLDLSCGMLQGTIHPNTSLFNLPRLQRLNLAFNDFYGSQIPREIGRFSKSVTHFNISHCGFSGQVPTNITLLHNLVSLDLSSNGNDFSLEPNVFINLLRNSTILKQLSLDSVNISASLPNHINISSSSLKSLRLLETRLQGKLPDDIFSSRSLEELDLAFNSFTGQIPREISLLPNLVSLDLSGDNDLTIQPNIFNSLLSNSTLLRGLWLRVVNISWVLPTDLINISSSLTYLDLSHCNLMGSLPKSPLNLTHLTYLDLSYNKLNGTLPSWLFTLPSLESLLLDQNMFSGDVPFISSALSPLNVLSLGWNQLGGQIDEALVLEFTNLTWLDLSYNNFSSDWELDTLLSSLTNLEDLHLSYSGLSIRTTNATHHANPNLQYLSVASCKLKEFPLSLRSMPNLKVLDLSSNEISGDVSILAGEIGGDAQLYHLDLSHNFITGLPQFQLYGLDYLGLESNQIQGPFPPSICNMSTLRFLNMSDNRIDGVIPQCLGSITSSLALMDLRKNDFHGTIPNVYEDCGSLQGLYLNENRLQGEVPSSLSKCQSLKVIDIGNNHLNGTFPHWLGGLPYLQILVLKSNRLNGPILTPSHFKKPFASLRVIDLSHNGFIGQLPRIYFQNFNSMKTIVRSTEPEYLMAGAGIYYSITVAMKGVEQKFLKVLVDYTIVDLSNNCFEGEIPAIIGDLHSLKVLNLSYNSLTGRIPGALGNLSEIESLDLSWNQLAGNIPQSLADINELEVLNLSQNHLVGRIPKGQQFDTFTADSFAGNPGLCGFQLSKDCEDPQDEDGIDEEESGFTWKPVVMGYGCGTLLGMVMGYLMLSTGKPKWFNAISDAVEHTFLNKRNKRRYIYIGR